MQFFLGFLIINEHTIYQFFVLFLLYYICRRIWTTPPVNFHSTLATATISLKKITSSALKCPSKITLSPSNLPSWLPNNLNPTYSSLHSEAKRNPRQPRRQQPSKISNSVKKHQLPIPNEPPKIEEPLRDISQRQRKSPEQQHPHPPNKSRLLQKRPWRHIHKMIEIHFSNIIITLNLNVKKIHIISRIHRSHQTTVLKKISPT